MNTKNSNIMYNFDLDYSSHYDDIRHRMMDCARGILEQNRRAFAKATKFPFVCLKDRSFGNLGTIKVSVVAESKSRMHKGVIGVSAFQVIETAPDEDGRTGYGLLHFEYNDNGGHYLYFLTPPFLAEYARHRLGRSLEDVPVDTVIKNYVKDSYWGSNGHCMLSADKALAAPSENALINGQPSYFVTFVIDGGVCFGLENKEKNIHVYYTYKQDEDVEEYSDEELKKVHDLMESKRRDFDENPWLYSPLATTIQKPDNNIIN